MIPTLRRDRDDVFLIGEESLLAEEDAAGDPDQVSIEGPGGRSSRRPRSHRLAATFKGPRGPALLGLAVGASVLAALRPWGGGTPDPTAHIASPRSPLISRSAAGAPARRVTRAHRPGARRAEVPPRGVVHHKRRPRRPQAGPPPRPEPTHREPEREPTTEVAPVSSPTVISTTEATAPPTAPTEGAPPAPPDPPPSSSGGGPGGVAGRRSPEPASAETFGFER